MSKTAFPALLLTVLSFAAAPGYGQDPTAPQPPPRDLRNSTVVMQDGSVVELDRMVVLPMPKSNKVVVKFMFFTGSAADPEGMEGLTYLVAQWIARGGTSSLTSNQLHDFLYPLAATIDVSVDKEVVVFTLEMHADVVEAAYPVLSDLLFDPRFDPSDFDRVKSNQKNYVDEVIKAASDEDYSKVALEERLFGHSPYGHLKQGYSLSLDDITTELAKEHFHMYFTSPNLMVGIAGNFSEALQARVASDVQRLPSHEQIMPDMPPPEMPLGIDVEIIAKEGALGSAIYTGTPLPVTRASDDFAALMVANSWLGEHRKSYSRLYQKIRQQRSMNYGDYSYIEWYEGGGNNMLPLPGFPRSENYFSIWIRPVQTADALKKAFRQDAAAGDDRKRGQVPVNLTDMPAAQPPSDGGDTGGSVKSEDESDVEQTAKNQQTAPPVEEVVEAPPAPDPDVTEPPSGPAAEIQAGHAHFALRMAIREMEQLVSGGMSQEDFEKTREFLMSYIKLYDQTPARKLGYLMDSRFYGRVDYLADMQRLLGSLTLEQVNEAMSKYLHPQQMYVTIVTDVSEAQPLRESLENNLPSPMIYPPSLRAVMPLDLLREDDEVANYGLNVSRVVIVASDRYFKRKLD